MPAEESVDLRQPLEIEATMNQLITRETNHLQRADRGDQATHQKIGLKIQIDQPIEMHFGKQVIIRAEDIVQIID